ncbi:MAG: sigma-70 family RNA polymerase sigma factor [Nannocystaceae bacterium]|nr:sigma-70 family RNA polymerase sigma factor [Nannocystaceae bacterium]
MRHLAACRSEVASITSLRERARIEREPETVTGELADLARMYQAHHDFVWRVLQNLGVERATIEDAVQDVFLVLHRRREAFDDRGEIRGLLFGIARRIARNHRRIAERPRRYSLPPELVRADDPDDAIARRQAAAIVAGFIERLDEDRRMVFVLSEIEGMPMPQVADALGIKLNTAYSRLRLARQQFHSTVALHRDTGAA